MPAHEPVQTPDEGSLQGTIAELEEELRNLRAELGHEQRTRRSAQGELRRARIRSDELQTALQQKQEQFLDMLARLQEREEQAVRRASDLAERTREAEAARERAEQAERDLRRIIAEAGKLLGETLDYRATLTSVARLSAPEIADWCIIDVVGEHGGVERVAVWGPESQQVLARRLLDECHPDSEYGLHTALTDAHRPAARPIDEDLLRAVSCPPEVLDSVRRLDLRSALVVPLLARGQLVGAMALLAGPDRPAYDENDILLAQELARRAATAVDNARLYDAAVSGSRAKSEFLAVVSHELRTPLSAIIGYTDLLRTGVAGEVTTQQGHNLDRIRASADHLLELIEEILSFTQLQAGRAQLDLEPTDVAGLTRDVADLLVPLAERKDLELTILGAEAPVRMNTDPRKLRQVLLNLMGNAIKFTDEGSVKVAIEEADERVRWTITDTGVGIEPQHTNEIFAPFWQVEQSRTRRNEGTGLGLTIASGLAELLGGSLSVQSELGVGSMFAVEIPLKPPQPETA